MKSIFKSWASKIEYHCYVQQASSNKKYLRWLLWKLWSQHSYMGAGRLLNLVGNFTENIGISFGSNKWLKWTTVISPVPMRSGAPKQPGPAGHTGRLGFVPIIFWPLPYPYSNQGDKIMPQYKGCPWAEAPNTPLRCGGGSRLWETWAQTILVSH